MASEQYHAERRNMGKTILEKIVSMTLNVALLAPALMWSFIALYSFVGGGIYVNASLFPFSFRVHALSLLSMSLFYIITFLSVSLREPLKKFSIALTLLFLSNAFYELIYGVLYDWTSLQLTLPLTAVGAVVLLRIDRRFRFLRRDGNGLTRFAACLSILFAVMLMLNQMGFFAEMRLYLTGQTANDPHNLLWIISKTLSLWMFLPLLKIRATAAKQRQTN